tara:strand:+ start:921 stop:2078 length:1158 start_codon:yes stop_codon:yes gene_type:complete
MIEYGMIEYGIIFGVVCFAVVTGLLIFNFLFKDDKSLSDQFKNLSNEILVQQADTIAKKATESVTSTNKEIIDPLKKQLDNIKSDFTRIEQDRLANRSTLDQKLIDLTTVHKELSKSTLDLKNSLSGNTTTGDWGEIKLRNIIENAGMTENVDFDIEKQTDFEGEDGKKRRADAVVNLADGGKIPIDAKTSLSAFLRISETDDEEQKKVYLDEHTNNVAKHIKDLKDREYHTLYSNSVPYTIMYVPHEPALNAAFQNRPKLFEDAIKNKIIVTSSASLYSLLQVIALGWSQINIAKNQEKMIGLAENLYKSIVTFTNLYAPIGEKIKSLSDAYNKSVSSFDANFSSKLTKLKDYGVDVAKLPTPKKEVKAIEIDTEKAKIKKFRD